MSEGPQITRDPDQSRFEARLDGIDAVGFAEYRVHDDAIEFPHTVVPPEMGGRGVASALAKAALAWAMDEKQWIVPSCSFFAGYIGKYPEYRDRVKPGFPLEQKLERLASSRS